MLNLVRIKNDISFKHMFVFKILVSWICHRINYLVSYIKIILFKKSLFLFNSFENFLDFHFPLVSIIIVNLTKFCQSVWNIYHKAYSLAVQKNAHCQIY